MSAAAEAPATIVGTVTESRALDERAFFAWLVVDRSLAGPHAAGERVAIAWDERVSDRGRRFADGQRILVALEPLPTWSIWRERLGEQDALGIALRGEAFLTAPDAATVDGVAAWLARPAPGRASVAALPELAALVAGAEPTVAKGALDRIAALPGLAAALDAPGGGAALASLRGALRDADRPERLRAALLALAGQRGLEAFAPELAALAGDAASGLAPDAIAAWAALPGGLPRADAARLLASSDPAVRAAVLSHAAGALDDATIEARLGGDPAPAVRAAAVAAWVARRGMDAWPKVAPRLDDPNAPEGAAAVRALGALGEPAVVPLATRARERELDGARGPMLALTFAGPQGVVALRALAADHPDPAARALATFLLGRPPAAH
ncbi:MAG TPA: hypothetical protein VKB65_10280 [Myxococcota bacterium]|nr:hypothetical protein [Myxococcota bacterium]